MDDGVRERAGVMGWQSGFVSLRESGDLITLSISDGAGVREVPVNAQAARRLSRQLSRFARRIDERGA